MSITRTEIAPDYPIFEIDHFPASARVAQQGAQIMEWTPRGHKPVLYMSRQAFLQKGKPIRGGVPVCWPWFGTPPPNTSLPAHGFVRNSMWEAGQIAESKDAATLQFSLNDSAESRALWPHPFHVTMMLEVGAQLHLSLRMENTSTIPQQLTGALHTYLAVGDIREVSVSGLDGADYMDTVGTWQVRRQQGDIRFDREVDRIYRSSNAVLVRDESLGRIIRVTGSGSETIVVWNPWIDKASRLADMPDDDYLRFLCVETANAWEDRIHLDPGASHELAVTISMG